MVNSFYIELYWLNVMKSDRKHIDVLPTIPTLARYDQEMFDFHNKIEALEEQWGREKQELAKVFESFLLFVGPADRAHLITFWILAKVCEDSSQSCIFHFGGCPKSRLRENSFDGYQTSEENDFDKVKIDENDLDKTRDWLEWSDFEESKNC